MAVRQPAPDVDATPVEPVEVATREAGAELVVTSVQVTSVQVTVASRSPLDKEATSEVSLVEPPDPASAPVARLAPVGPVENAQVPGRNDLDRVRPAGAPGQRPRQPGSGRGPAPRPGDRRPPDGARPVAPDAPAEDVGDNGAGNRGGSGCTGPQLKRFIKSRVYVPMHELRRRFQIEGDDDDVVPVSVGAERVYIGLPEREGRLLGELLRGGDVGYELSMDPPTPIVVGVYPMRPIPRG